MPGRNLSSPKFGNVTGHTGVCRSKISAQRSRVTGHAEQFEMVQYSCILYWASHFFEARDELIDALDTFLRKHLLYCLSELGELRRTGILSLRSAATVLLVSDSPC